MVTYYIPQIDDISEEHPVWLNRMDGHMYLANSLAMRLAGVDKNTPDTPGGTIVRLGDGEPSGIFKDNATNWYANYSTLYYFWC